MKILDKFVDFENFANNRLQKASFCILLFATVAFSQEFNMNNMPPPEASMRYSAGTLQKGSTVIVDIVIPDNWHVNANIAADEFLKPSSIEISAKGIHFGEPKWPEPIKEYSEALDLENLVFKGYFQIKLPVDSVEAGYDSLTTQATFHYQACDNSICLAPSSVTFGVGATGFKSKTQQAPGRFLALESRATLSSPTKGSSKSRIPSTVTASTSAGTSNTCSPAASRKSATKRAPHADASAPPTTSTTKDSRK